MAADTRRTAAVDRSRRWAATALSAALLSWSVLANLGLGERLYLVRNLILTVGLLVLARVLGLSASELGLGRTHLRRGWWWGLGAAVVVAATLGVAVAVREHVGLVAFLLEDDRAALPAAELLYHATVRIPLGTAVFEEVAFRGVLLALLLRVMGPWRAMMTSSVVFGLWHVAPTIVALRINDVVPTSVEGISAIVGAVIVTTVAGLLFCLLRRWSGSLVAPILAHWATNGLGLLAAATAGSS